MADIKIGGRLHSTATGNIVAGANEILDDNKNKKQSEVNREVDETFANYNSRINALSEQNYITVEATSETTNITTLINSSGHGQELDTIYRVSNWDGSQYTTDTYCEYAYDEATSSYKFLHKINYGIDDIPTDNSNNLVKSGGIKSELVKLSLQNSFLTCSTTAGTAAKEISITGFAILNGGSIKVKFTYVNTATNPTLNINNTGAKAILYNGVVASAENTWAADEVVEFYYDPTYNSNAGAYYGVPSIITDKFASGEQLKDVVIFDDFKTSIVDLISSNKGKELNEQLQLLNKSIGSDFYIERTVINVDYSSLNVGGIYGSKLNHNIGSTLSFSTSSGYRYGYITDVVQEDLYEVSLYVSAYSDHYQFYIYWTDNENKIINSDWINDAVASTLITKLLLCPKGATRMWFMTGTTTLDANKPRINKISFNKVLSHVVKESEKSILGLNNSIGDVHTIQTVKSFSSEDNSGVKLVSGTPVEYKSTTAYWYNVYTVSPGDKYLISTYVGTSSNYPNYVAATDNNDFIIQTWLSSLETGDYQSVTIIIPEGATKLFVLSYGSIANYASVKTLTYNNLQSQIDAITEGLMPVSSVYSMRSHKDMFNMESTFWVQEKYLEDLYATQEQIGFNAFKTIFQVRAGEGIYQIAVLSDTHGSGAYTWKYLTQRINKIQTCLRPIAVYNKILQLCNAGLHGGDISCDYGTSRNRVLEYMYNIIRRVTYTTTSEANAIKPFFITKGNHDENNNAYIEVKNPIDLNWVNKTYYKRNFSTFTAITESEWNGDTIYENKTELVSDKEFRNMVQHWLMPPGAVWGPGAYYYFDIADYKIRFIVANSFPVDDTHSASVIVEQEEYAWCAGTALDLSSKNNPQEWQVMMLRHTECTSITNLVNMINAFQNGTTFTYNGIDYDYSTINGGGCTFIGHFHGHEHQNCISNNPGFPDVGLDWTIVEYDDLGDSTKYGINVLTVDSVNKLVWQDWIGGKSWCYDYANNKIVLNSGESIVFGRSGLGNGAYCESSDTSIATCDGLTVTAVGSGNCTITVYNSGGTLSKVNYIKVN